MRVSRKILMTGCVAAAMAGPIGNASATVVHFYPHQPYTPVTSPENLVANGNFNIDPLADPAHPTRQNPTITDWTVTTADPRDRVLTTNNNSGVVGGRGLRLAGFNGLSDISQSLATVNGQQYELSFFLATTGPTGTHLAILENGTTLDVLNNVPTNVTTGPNYTAFFSEYLYDFVATSDITALTFEYQNPKNDLYLSNVAVLPVDEPADVAVLAAGIGMLALCRRRSGERTT